LARGAALATDAKRLQVRGELKKMSCMELPTEYRSTSFELDQGLGTKLGLPLAKPG
jgi:hypothetical protein